MNGELDERCPTCFERVPHGGACEQRVCQVDADNRVPTDLPVGTELHGQFLIGRVLGRGGFGITYLAWHQRLARRVAVKECYPFGLVHRGRDGATVVPVNETARRQFELGREMFLREARLVAQFHDHPGVVSVLWVFEECDTAYMVMEFLQGQTLEELLEEHPDRRVPYERALQLMKPAMEALQAVHEDGLLHRDISPDNLFLPKRGGVKLLDFGAARYTMGQQTRSLPVILKEGYAPPEQYYAKGQQGPWTDVYAMAATVYRALTGAAPPAALDRVAEDDLVSPSGLGVGIPRAAEAALLKALTVKAEARTRSIAELLAGLMTADVRAVDKTVGSPSDARRSGGPSGPAREPTTVGSESAPPSVRPVPLFDGPAENVRELSRPIPRPRDSSGRALAIALIGAVVLVAIGWLIWNAFNDPFGGVEAESATPTAPATPPYIGAYRKGFDAYANQDWRAAAAAMTEARIAQPEGRGVSAVQLPNGTFEPYLPSYFLGTALAKQEDCKEANVAWEHALRATNIKETKYWQQLEKDRDLCPRDRGQATAESDAKPNPPAPPATTRPSTPDANEPPPAGTAPASRYPDEFVQGFKAFASRNWSDAARLMESARRKHPRESGDRVFMPGVQVEGRPRYLPSYFIGSAYPERKDCAKAVEAWDVAMKTPAATDTDLRRRMDDGRANCKPPGSRSSGVVFDFRKACSHVSRETWEEYHQGVQYFTAGVIASGSRQRQLLDRAKQSLDRVRNRPDGRFECGVGRETYTPLYYLGWIAFLSERETADGQRRACEYWRQGNRDTWQQDWRAQFREFRCLPADK
jgi:serine/threonine protein kinase